MRDAFWFFHPHRARYGEVDRQSVVFNAHYLAWFDAAITEYWRALGYDYMAQLEEGATDFHVVRAEIDFHGPVRYDEVVEIGCRTARIGRSSIAFALAVFGVGEATARVSGRIVQVHTDQRSLRSVNLPEALVQRIEARECPERG